MRVTRVRVCEGNGTDAYIITTRRSKTYIDEQLRNFKEHGVLVSFQDLQNQTIMLNPDLLASIAVWDEKISEVKDDDDN